MYKCEFKVKIFEVNAKQELTLFYLLNSLQQAAYEDSSQRFFSAHKLWEKGYSWVLTRLYLEIDNLPKLNDDYTVSTYSVNLNKFYAKRDFLIENNKAKLVKATTLWSLLDIKERKIVPIPKKWLAIHEKKPDILNFPKNKPKKNLIYDYKHTYTTRKQDLDLNRHINNSVFVLLALESIPPNIEVKYSLHSLDILFLKECSQIGENITCKLKDQFPRFHCLLEDSKKNTLATLTITY